MPPAGCPASPASLLSELDISLPFLWKKGAGISLPGAWGCPHLLPHILISSPLPEGEGLGVRVFPRHKPCPFARTYALASLSPINHLVSGRETQALVERAPHRRCVQHQAC